MKQEIIDARAADNKRRIIQAILSCIEENHKIPGYKELKERGIPQSTIAKYFGKLKDAISSIDKDVIDHAKRK